MVGHPYIHAILVAITSRNAGTVRTRTVASALYNMCVQASSIISSNIYRDEDKPLYRKGNKILIAICCYNFALFVGAKVYYVRVNRRREDIWSRMGKDERETYLETTTDVGNKRQVSSYFPTHLPPVSWEYCLSAYADVDRRLDFRFAH
jgi:hypothetical protein